MRPAKRPTTITRWCPLVFGAELIAQECNKPPRVSGNRRVGCLPSTRRACELPNAGAGPISLNMATNGNDSSLARKSRAAGAHKLIRQRIGQYPYLAVATGAGVAWVLAGGLTARKMRRVLETLGSLTLISPMLSRLFGMGVTVLNPRST